MITLANCRDILIEHANNPCNDILGQAGAWKVVHAYCVQRGMQSDIYLSGIENVILFLETLKDVPHEIGEQKNT